MSVRKLWSFYYPFIGLRCHNYALYLCFIYIYIYCLFVFYISMPLLESMLLSLLLTPVEIGPSNASPG